MQAVFTEPPSSPSEDGPCHCSQPLVWFLLKLAHGDQQDGVGRTEALAKHTGRLPSLNCLSRTVLLVLTPVSENSETSFHQSNSVIHWFQGV